MKKKSRVIMTALVLLWAGLIFWFSSQNGDQSSQMSGSIVEQLIRIVVPQYDRLSAVRQLEILDTFTFLIRKTAHFCEYLVLGALLWGWCLTFGFSKKKLFGYPWLAGSIYAVTDEFHQMFSDGRSPQMRDVGIDSVGVLCGILICFAACLLRQHWQQRHLKK